ncbi:cytidine deaminase [Enterocloster sp.]|uniref:cytidine deaminase n=1 Tax=Enterocloster sp. TaxID=2719315 RepID=UPI0039A02AEB
MERELLIQTALDGLGRSYAPYSHFHVSAALLCRDGKVYTGNNIENAAYSPGICAERCAFAKAVSEGEREFEAIVICGGPDGKAGDYCPPCGVCRQVMREFCADDFKIILAKAGGMELYTLAALLPESFSPDDLR